MTISATAPAMGFPTAVPDVLNMTLAEVTAAVEQTIAGAYDDTPAEFASYTPEAADGSPALASPQAVLAVNAINAIFGKKRLIKLSRIAEKHWSSMAAVSALIFAAIQARKAATK